MTTRYQKEQIEDVANIISFEMGIYPERPNRTPTLRAVAYQFADLFAADNTNFDRERFLVACGLDDAR